MALLPLIAIASIAAKPPATPAMAGFEPLTARPGQAALCTRDRTWCIGGVHGATPLVITVNGKQIARWSPDAPEDDLQLQPLPHMLRFRDGSALVPVEAREPVMYSGGGGEITRLHLIHVRPGMAPRTVLIVPWHTDLMIRACFSEKDEAARAGACHDEYAFDGKLTAVKSRTSAPPMLVYAATAQSFPRGVSRTADSLTLPPLKKSDLIWINDRTCSYRRTFTFDKASGRYKPDMPLPACDQYSSR
ncbi:hypothetical protein [Sphingomonas sp.]|uniref:hypothetical protein n=1 Tax=Sphingomonas sp. TaxID=28214 RepID=UPI003B3B451C